MNIIIIIIIVIIAFLALAFAAVSVFSIMGGKNDFGTDLLNLNAVKVNDKKNKNIVKQLNNLYKYKYNKEEYNQLNKKIKYLDNNLWNIYYTCYNNYNRIKELLETYDKTYEIDETYKHNINDYKLSLIEFIYITKLINLDWTLDTNYKNFIFGGNSFVTPINLYNTDKFKIENYNKFNFTRLSGGMCIRYINIDHVINYIIEQMNHLDFNTKYVLRIMKEKKIVKTKDKMSKELITNHNNLCLKQIGILDLIKYIIVEKHSKDEDKNKYKNYNDNIKYLPKIILSNLIFNKKQIELINDDDTDDEQFNKYSKLYLNSWFIVKQYKMYKYDELMNNFDLFTLYMQNTRKICKILNDLDLYYNDWRLSNILYDKDTNNFVLADFDVFKINNDKISIPIESCKRIKNVYDKLMTENSEFKLGNKTIKKFRQNGKTTGMKLTLLIEYLYLHLCTMPKFFKSIKFEKYDIQIKKDNTSVVEFIKDSITYESNKITLKLTDMYNQYNNLLKDNGINENERNNILHKIIKNNIDEYLKFCNK